MEFGESSFYQDFKWFIWIEKVKDLKSITWDEAESLTTIDFLNALAYIKGKGEQQKREMDKMSKKVRKR